MMQHLASNKPESAASALPLDISRGNRASDKSSQSFNQVLREETARPSAFEQARKNASNSASDNASVSNTNNRNKALDDRQAIREAASRKTAEGDAVNQQKDLMRKNKQADESRVNDQNDSSLTNKDLSASKKGNSSEATNASSLSDGISKEEDFDYIDYVSELALLSDKSALAKAEEQSDMTKIITINPIDSENQDAQLSSADLAATDQEDMEGLLQLGIDKSQLQTILDAQNAQLDLNAELSDEEQMKLQAIIANMLNTLQSESGGDNQSLDHEALAKVNKADKALLEQLLLHPAKAEQSEKFKLGEQSGLDIEQYPSGLDARISTLENAAKTPTLVNNHEHIVAPTQGVDKASLLDEKGKKEVDGIGNPERDPAAELKISDKDVWRKTPEIHDISKLPDNTLKTNAAKTETVKTPLDNIAALNDEQSKLAMNSLQERVQSLVSDLKTEGKGNEFIAALQSGVKEFKQQLAQGREPGINLKDMVAEALSVAGVEVDKSVQAKVDSSVSQFNAVLNLANAVNYSASQQQAQVLGITDNQLAKEINHQQIEGTKLANATTNANNQAMLDKAVNIYKAEGQAQLAEKVRWMVNSKNPSAEIRLDPPDLGAVNIKVNLSGDSAQVNFTVQSAAAKEALDQAVPRLRDMLQQQGIELGQSSVQQDSQGQQGAEQQGEFAQSGQNSGAVMSNTDSNEIESQDFAQGHIEQRVTGGSLGGIDYYA